MVWNLLGSYMLNSNNICGFVGNDSINIYVISVIIFGITFLSHSVI